MNGFLEIEREVAQRRWKAAGLLGVSILVAGFMISSVEVSEQNLLESFRKLFVLPAMMIPPSLGSDPAAAAPEWGWALLETLSMALVGTTAAFLISIPLGFLGARNVSPNFYLRISIRRSLDIVRGIDVLIWALIFIGVVGQGAFCGILAIMVSNIGELSKLFAETIENTRNEPRDGILSAGGSWLSVQRYARLPEALPVLLSTGLYYFESNVRSSSILGFLGAGGIGYLVYDRLQGRIWDQVGALLLIILLTVALIDFISGKLRRHLIKGKEGPLIVLQSKGKD